jgi:putative tryptophan/tyrosine transport system substrate-binding protein
VRRRYFISLLGGVAVALPLVAVAQQPNRLPTLGFLSNASPDAFSDRVDAFRTGLRDSGYIEDRTVVIEYRWAEGHNDRLPRLAAELVDLKVAAIAAIGGPNIAFAAKAATTTIPIVFQTGVDPVEIGLVASLAQPGGNITGITSLNVDVGRKRLELMHMLVPQVTDMALLVNPTNPTNAANDAKEARLAASNMGVQLHVLQASTEDAFNEVFAKLLQLRVGALLFGSDALFTSHRERLVELSLRNSVPTISPYSDFAKAGGLMSYGGDILNSWYLSGVYTGRVLKGEKPANLPVQQATKVELILNLKTAKRLGIAVPEAILARADQVIE